MPKAVGAPITLTAAQPMREVDQFTVNVKYVNGVPILFAHAYSTVRTRDAGGNVVIDGASTELVALADAQIPAGIHASFVSVLTALDTLP